VTHTAQVSIDTAEREVIVSRVINAPREVVFEAWMDPGHLAQWWGPHGFTNTVRQWDPRPGGAIVIHTRDPKGAVYPMKGTFHDVVAPGQIVFTLVVEDGAGLPLLNEITTVTFTEQQGKTKVTVHVSAVGVDLSAWRMLDRMESSWSESLERLEDVNRKR
jgi:uncharacterized protein YndB with AHSA1/START domain